MDSLTLTLSCPMFLHYYPLDQQKCLIDLASCKLSERLIDTNDHYQPLD